VLSVPEGIPLSCLFLAGYQGLDTHRKGRDTIPCDGPGECSHCKHKSGIIWKGYAPIHAWDQTSRLWHPFVLELTESLEEELRGRDLRGEVWSLWRCGKGLPNDPVTGLFAERRRENDVSPAFDIVPVLLRMYHVSSLRLGRPNSMPPKICLEAVAAPAPKLPDGVAELVEPQASEEKKKSFAEMRREHDEKMRRRQQTIDQANKAADKHETNGTTH
jgi:hypothetical protein